MTHPTIRQRILAALAESPRPLRATALADRVGARLHTTRCLLAELRRAGEVERVPSCLWRAVRGAKGP